MLLEGEALEGKPNHPGRRSRRRARPVFPDGWWRTTAGRSTAAMRWRTRETCGALDLINGGMWREKRRPKSPFLVKHGA